MRQLGSVAPFLTPNSAPSAAMPPARYQALSSSNKPVVVPTDSSALALARAALEKGFGAKTVLMRGGGSVPVVETFKEKLGVAALLVGYGSPGDNLHSPNEKFSLEDFHRGIKTAAYLVSELGRS